MPTATEIPVWLQQLIGLGAFIGTAFGAVLVGRKTKTEAGATGEATVLAGSLVGGKQIDRIVDHLASVESEMRETREQRHRDSLGERECMEALGRALRENADAHRSPSMTPEFLALLTRLRGME